MLTAAEARAMTRANVPGGVEPFLAAADQLIRGAVMDGGTSCELPANFGAPSPPTLRQRAQVEAQLAAAGYRVDAGPGRILIRWDR